MASRGDTDFSAFSACYSDSKAGNTTTACFGGVPGWRPQRNLVREETSQQPQYTDADLANDMNALSFSQRQAIFEDIHGVSSVIEETEEFVEKKIQEFWQHLDTTFRSVDRDAWDRAVFLRPSLASKAHTLTFLRAARFDPSAAASMLLRFYESKRLLWGDDLLTQRISWDDLTMQEQTIVRCGGNVVLPKNRECQNTPAITYLRIRTWDLDSADFTPTIKALIYPVLNLLFENSGLQRQGLITIVDCRGLWKATGMRLLQFAAKAIPLLESQPDHTVAMHFLVEDAAVHSIVKTMQTFFPLEQRIRCRIHFGSAMEICYSLQTYGIELPGEDGSISAGTPNFSRVRFYNPFLADAMESKILEWQAKDKEWRDSETPFRDETSRSAMCPNPQDILLGRNKMIASKWPGNVTYGKVIRVSAQRYMEEQDRLVRITMAMHIVDTLQHRYKARFLMRKESCWEAASESEIKSKVSQALRDEARSLAKQHQRKR